MAQPLEDIDVIEVPAEYVEHSCGFSLDIGGSVAKLVYRSSEDYKDAKPLKDFGKFDDGRVKGRLRLVLVPRNHLDLVIDYVKTRCDMTSRDGAVTVNTTGIGGNFFRERLQKELDIKTTNIFESDCFVKAFSLLRDILPYDEFVTPLPTHVIEKAQEVMKSFEKINEEWNVGTLSSEVKDVSLENKDGGKEEASSSEKPNDALLIMCGSGFGMMSTDAVKGESKHQFVEGIWKGGRSFLGLSRMMTGLDNYDDIMALAETADGKSVDMWSQDVKSPDVVDAYSLMPDDFPVFPFGKAIGVPKDFGLPALACEVCKSVLGERDYKHPASLARLEHVKDQLNKGDLVYSLLNLICSDMCVVIYLTCLRTELRDVYFVGNFVKHPKTQEIITQQLTMKNMQLAPGNKPINFQFVKNGGHFGALGAYLSDSIQSKLQK